MITPGWKFFSTSFQHGSRQTVSPSRLHRVINFRSVLLHSVRQGKSFPLCSSSISSLITPDSAGSDLEGCRGKCSSPQQPPTDNDAFPSASDMNFPSSGTMTASPHWLPAPSSTSFQCEGFNCATSSFPINSRTQQTKTFVEHTSNVSSRSHKGAMRNIVQIKQLWKMQQRAFYCYKFFLIFFHQLAFDKQERKVFPILISALFHDTKSFQQQLRAGKY